MSAVNRQIIPPDSEKDISKNPVNWLLIAIIHVQDERKAVKALEKIGLTAVRFSSTGAFLGRHNVTLLIGITEGQEAIAINVIQKNCHERIEYVSTPLESAPLPVPISTPITVGGATLFAIKVERYLEI